MQIDWRCSEGERLFKIPLALRRRVLGCGAMLNRWWSAARSQDHTSGPTERQGGDTPRTAVVSDYML